MTQLFSQARQLTASLQNFRFFERKLQRTWSKAPLGAVAPTAVFTWLMARDYYPLIVQALERLADKSAEARRSVYDHARAVLVRKVREIDFGLSAGLNEFDALDEIRRAESRATGEGGLVASMPEPKPSTLAEPCYDPLWKRLCLMAANGDPHQ